MDRVVSQEIERLPYLSWLAAFTIYGGRVLELEYSDSDPEMRKVVRVIDTEACLHIGQATGISPALWAGAVLMHHKPAIELWILDSISVIPTLKSLSVIMENQLGTLRCLLVSLAAIMATSTISPQVMEFKSMSMVRTIWLRYTCIMQHSGKYRC